MLVGQRAPHRNGQTKPCGFILDGQAPEGFAVAIGIMDKVPTPHIMLRLGPRLHGAPGTELSAAFSAWESQPLLLPHLMNPLEIHRLATALEKAPC